jgi:hypothetical protein
MIPLHCDIIAYTMHMWSLSIYHFLILHLPASQPQVSKFKFIHGQGGKLMITMVQILSHASNDSTCRFVSGWQYQKADLHLIK